MLGYALFTFLIFIIHIGVGIKIVKELEKKGVKVNWWLLRFKMFGYVKRYKEVIEKETGETPRLYTFFVISLIVLIFFVILCLVISS